MAVDLGLTSQDVAYLVGRSRSEGVAVFTQLLPKLGKALERGLATGQFESPHGFKLFTRGCLPHFMGSLFLRVFRKDGSAHPKPCSWSVYAIRQVCYFFYKVDMPYHEKLRNKVKNNFLTTDSVVSSWNVAFSEFSKLKGDKRNRLDVSITHRCFDSPEGDVWEFDSRIFRTARALVRQIFKDFRLWGDEESRRYLFDKMQCRHSSGTVSEGWNQLDKHDPFRGECRSLKPWAHFDEFLTPFASANDMRGAVSPVWDHHGYWPGSGRKTDTSEVLLVPKDSRGPRLICREPADYQYLQQGLKHAFIEAIESSPLTGGQINFIDQSINGRLARYASVTKRMSTLDLKDASDRVPSELVRYLFQDVVSLRDALFALRTDFTRIELDGKVRVIPLAKYAPMGSAMCFPVLSIVGWAFSTAAILIKMSEQSGFVPNVAEVSKSVFVYGDDIIVPTDYAHDCVRALTNACLRVNTDKSFIGSSFAESCGYDWHMGNLVSPVRLRSQCQETPENITRIVATAQLAHEKGLHLTAELLYTMSELPLGPLPYGTSRASYLCRVVPESESSRLNIVNFDHCRLIKSNMGILSTGVKAWVVRPEPDSGRESGYARLSRILPQMGGGQDYLHNLLDSNRPRELSNQGEYTPPRRVSLRKRLVPMQ